MMGQQADVLSELQRAHSYIVARRPEDAAQIYYGAWHRLIRHWQSVLGERLLVVRYEDLGLDYEANVRRLLAHCGLRWDDEFLAFQKQTKTVTTASAAQVRWCCIRPPSVSGAITGIICNPYQSR
jgi:hypothetical protein